MRTLHSALLLLLAVSCGDKDDTGEPDSELCEETVDITPVYPLDGQTDVYYRSALHFTLSDPDVAVVVTLESDAGEVAGAVTVDGSDLWFTPDEPLSPDTAHTVTITACASEVSLGFTTSNLGAPVTGEIEGRTFAVDSNSGRVVAPEGGEVLVAAALGGVVLLSVVSDEATMELQGALSGIDTTDQDTCNRTVFLPDVDYSAAPYFEMPPSDMELSIGAEQVTINDLSIAATFRSDGSGFDAGTLTAEVDVREVGPILGDTFKDATADELCELLGGLDIACTACGVDGEAYCVGVELADISADVTEETMQTITAPDCHETCALSCDNKECSAAESFEICL